MRFEKVLTKEGDVKYPNAKQPVYETKTAVGCDFFSAVKITVPAKNTTVKPTLITTGMKASFPEDVCLQLANRSSNPGKLGLVLANGVGIVESDYYGNPDNDGELMFAFYNITDEDVIINEGDKLGQGVFYRILRASNYDKELASERQGGFGSTDKV